MPSPERLLALEEAAQACDRQGDLYAAYAAREAERATHSRDGPKVVALHNEQFYHRDVETCRELARIVRALKTHEPDPLVFNLADPRPLHEQADDQ